MDTRVRKLLAATVVIALLLLAALIAIATWQERVRPSADYLARWEIYVDAFQIVLAGFLVTLLGVLIPRGFSEARHSFERLKESRVAYSRATTGIRYLPLRLSTMNLGRASTVLQQVHVWKHTAELYPELQRHLNWRKDSRSIRTREDWGDDKYEQLAAVCRVLMMHADDWDTMSPAARLRELTTAVESAQVPHEGNSAKSGAT